MLPAFLAGANFVEHAAGWLESGLVACYEKFIVDIEMLRMLQEEFTPLEIDEASLAYGAHQEVGHGGHFLGAAHTLERFRTCFYRPLLSSTENFERWKSKGGRDATERAGEIWRETLEPTSSRRSTPTCARSSRATRPAAARSSAIEDHRRPRLPAAAALRRRRVLDGGRVGRGLRLADRRRRHGRGRHRLG